MFTVPLWWSFFAPFPLDDVRPESHLTSSKGPCFGGAEYIAVFHLLFGLFRGFLLDWMVSVLQLAKTRIAQHVRNHLK